MIKIFEQSLNNEINLKNRGCYIYYLKNIDADLTINIFDKNICVKVFGTYIGKETYNKKINIYINHFSSSTRSNVLIKSILFDKSKLEIETNLNINKNLEDIIASEKSTNLMASENSRFIAKPNLNINTGTIICSHSVSSGQISKDYINFFGSRGINKSKAEKLIYENYFNDSLVDLSEEKRKIFRKEISKLIIN